MSTVFDVTGHDEEAGVEAAAAAVARGELVVVPTDTVYGIGADAFDAEAVAELLAAKGRGREMPPPVLVPNPRTIDGLATAVPAYARRLVDRYWPGPLTLVLRAQGSLMWDLGDTNGTVAVRMPDLESTLTLLAETGPLAVSSANRHGQEAATTLEAAREQLGELVAVYLDGGTSPGGRPSTIVDCTKDEPEVLREGAVSWEEILGLVRGEDPADRAPGDGGDDGASGPAGAERDGGAGGPEPGEAERDDREETRRPEAHPEPNPQPGGAGA